MSKLIIPADYKPALNLKQTEQAIKNINDFFLQSLSTELRLRRVIIAPSPMLTRTVTLTVLLCAFSPMSVSTSASMSP